MFRLRWERFIRIVFFDIFKGRWYRINEVFVWALLIWFLEWCFVIEYLFGEWWRSYIIIPARVPALLVVCIFYWSFIWGFAVWRRTQFGKFTRGDHKLWAKGLAAFWVVELVTIGSILIAYCWMNWGPLPLVPRRLIWPRRGVLLEFIIYSYIFYIGYILKLCLSWCEWSYQLTCCYLVLIIFFILLWRDALCLLFRDPLESIYGTRWRNIRLSAVIYSLTHEWWLGHTLGRRGPNSHFLDISSAYKLKLQPIVGLDVLTEYEQRHWLPEVWAETRYKKVTWGWSDWSMWYYENFDLLNRGYYYPRRMGYIPKRLGMWQFLMFLKMFHHLVILLWWVLLTYRCYERRDSSFSFLASCQFNVYCCFLLTFMIYFIYYALYWETFFKLRPGVFSIRRFGLMFIDCLQYLKRGFLWSWKQKSRLHFFIW